MPVMPLTVHEAYGCLESIYFHPALPDQQPAYGPLAKAAAIIEALVVQVDPEWAEYLSMKKQTFAEVAIHTNRANGHTQDDPELIKLVDSIEAIDLRDKTKTPVYHL